MKPETAGKIKYGVWGLIVGAVIAMIIGFACEDCFVSLAETVCCLIEFLDLEFNASDCKVKSRF